MYETVKMYECSICHKKEIGRDWYPGIQYGIYHLVHSLPEGWVGSSRQFKDCFCKECNEAIQELKSNNKKTFADA